LIVEKATHPAPMELPPLPPEPLVTVVIGNYNYARFLPEAVESVRSQTYKRWELIICDDGSTDDSREVLERLAGEDPRIRLLFKENGGLTTAWNCALEHSSGDIICLFDADDIMLPNKLEAVCQAFHSNPRAGYVYHKFQLIDSTGRPFGSDQPGVMHSGWLHDRAVRSGGHVIHSNSLVTCLRRELADRVFPLPIGVGPFGDRYIANLAVFMTEVSSIPECLAYYRIHDRNNYGTDRLDPSTLRVVIDATNTLFPFQRQFLVDHFPDEIASNVRLADARPYWEHLAAIHLLNGTDDCIVDGHSVPEIVSNLKGSNRFYAWRLLFALPDRLSRGLLRLWWGNAWWKRYVRRFTRSIGGQV
jgi:glycosyltransferase involved in cell wall biosynthesis